MQVFKFGGASVKNAEAVRNLESILRTSGKTNMVIVISAMAKTTNSLEQLAKDYFDGNDWRVPFARVKEFHLDVVNELFSNQEKNVYEFIIDQLDALEAKLNTDSSLNFNFEYDQIVSFGEIFSTSIVSHYLNFTGISNQWLDARKLLRTNSNFREASIDWNLSAKLFQKSVDFAQKQIFITQGFIASDKNNATTTLGREGSDFTAAAIAYMLDAESVTVWKDVPGVLNADPKYFNDTIKLDRISYLDAIELAYYGTSVIHPKTIQPLQQKKIQLFVKSFLEPSLPGTVISNEKTGEKIPCFIVKKDQTFLHISTRDFSFIVESHLREIFRVFAKHGLHINIMQNSAISFDVCVNNDETRIPGVTSDLQENFVVADERGVELITIRHYNENIVKKMLVGKKLVLEQKLKENIQLVIKQ